MPKFEIEIEWSLRTMGRQHVEVEADSLAEALAGVREAPLEYFDQAEAESEIMDNEYEFEISAEGEEPEQYEEL